MIDPESAREKEDLRDAVQGMYTVLPVLALLLGALLYLVYLIGGCI